MSERLGPQFMGGLLPSAPVRKPAGALAKPVWWKVVQQDGTTKLTRNVQTFTDDAREVIRFMGKHYPHSVCVSITRMKRAPK